MVLAERQRTEALGDRSPRRLLLLTQVVPFPPDSGPKVKTYNVLRYLAQRYEVHLASFARSPAEEASARSLRNLCASVTTVPLHRSRARDAGYLARSLGTGRPFLIERDDLPTMRSTVSRLLAESRFDVVHADQLSMGQYAVDLPVPLRVLDEHNAVWTIVRRAAEHEPWGPARVMAALEWRKLRAYEGRLCGRFDRVCVVSEDDRRALEAAAGGLLPAEVIPIGVDTEALAFVPRTAEARHVLSVATMFYPPNAEGVAWFAERVFPRVRQAVPGTRFLVVGSRPPSRIRRLAHPKSGVVVAGYIADLGPILAQSAVLVVPVHAGSGMRVKILEAFARGIPVVSTRVGVEGIEARDGEHLLVADTPEAFAEALAEVLAEPERSAHMARAARSLVEARYDWRRALAGLDRLYAPTTPRQPVSWATG